MNQLNQWLQKIDALSLRERIILFVLMLAGIWAVLDAALLAPQERMRQEEQQKIAQARVQMAEAEQTLVLQASQPDPDRDARRRLESARQALDARMQTALRLQARMVAPKDQVRVLQSMLAANPGLRLGRLETLAAEPVGQPTSTGSVLPPQASPPASAVANATTNAKAPTTALYKHGVRLTLVGNYAALTRYLEKLESLPVGFYWSRAELDATGHPEISLTLTLYTLSLERTWLTV